MNLKSKVAKARYLIGNVNSAQSAKGVLKMARKMSGLNIGKDLDEILDEQISENQKELEIFKQQNKLK